MFSGIDALIMIIVGGSVIILKICLISLLSYNCK